MVLYQNALDAIKAAKEAGVDAVKIQTYTPDSMTIDTNNEDFIIKEGLWKNRTLYDLYNEGYTPYEWHKKIFDFAKNNITLFSTPFDEEAVDLLDSFNVPAYKVASFELVDFPLIKYIAKRISQFYFPRDGKLKRDKRCNRNSKKRRV